MRKGNWPQYPFTKWEKMYIARRVLEHSGELIHDAFRDDMFPNNSYGYAFPRRPKSDMPVHYLISYLDQFASYIIGIGLKEHRAGLREAILGRLNERTIVP